MQKVRNISPITNSYLLICIVNCCVCIGRILELDDAKRHAIDIEKYVGTTGFLLSVIYVLNGKLIYSAKNIILRVLKVDKRNHTGKTVLRCELHPIYHPAIYGMKRGEFTLRTNKAHLVHNLMNFIGCQVRTCLAQELLHIIGI